MTRPFLAAILLMTTLGGSAVADTQVYKIDAAHSRIGFAVKHMMVSTVRGQFDSFAGTISYNPDDLTRSSVEVTIDAASIDTNNDDRDEDLRSNKFFGVDKFPTLTFKSKQIKKTADGWTAVGELKIRDVVREVEIPFVLAGPVKNPWGQMVIGVEGQLVINRMDYDVKWNTPLEAGGVLVDEMVTIEFALEAKPAPVD